MLKASAIPAPALNGSSFG